jgi:hypothetical protein
MTFGHDYHILSNRKAIATAATVHCHDAWRCLRGTVALPRARSLGHAAGAKKGALTMFVDGGGWRPPAEPSPKRPAPQRNPAESLWPILLSVALMFGAPIGIWQVAQQIMTVTWR